jgi:hypothetical protein
MALATVFLLTLTLATTSLARMNPVLEPAAVIDMQQTIFPSGGLLEIKDSLGAVEIAGWDRPQIEVMVTKSTDRKYAPEEIEKANEDLDRIVVTTRHLTDQHVVIRTEFPGHSVLRLLGGRSKVHLTYVIHVPRQTRLMVKQQMGELKIHEVSASMILSNRIGDIEVTLPATEKYSIDAKARVGGVNSELCEEHVSKDDGIAPHRLQLRVDVGDITVRQASVASDSLV